MISRPRHVVLGAAWLIGGLIAAASVHQDNAGKQLFDKRCSGCHALDRNKEGPRLGSVYGRKAGTVDSFQYSEVLSKSSIIWNDESLDHWLADPDQFAPGNNMTFFAWRTQKNGGRSSSI